MDMKLKKILNESYAVIDPRGNARPIGSKVQGDRYVKGKKGHYVILQKHALKARRAIEKAGGNATSKKMQDMMFDLRYENMTEINEVMYDVRGLNDLKGNYYEMGDEISAIESNIKEVLSTMEGEEWEAETLGAGALAKELKIFGAIKKLFAKSKLGKVL